MQDKLTLRLEEKLIRGAREYAKSQQKSLKGANLNEDDYRDHLRLLMH